MSLQPAGLATAFAPVATVEIGSPVPTPATAGDDEALEFVRFCYRRRRVAWPALYDEMSVVAGRGLFRGMNYCALAEHGISFCLEDLPRLVALTGRVVREDQPVTEPVITSLSLRAATA